MYANIVELVPSAEKLTGLPLQTLRFKVDNLVEAVAYAVHDETDCDSDDDAEDEPHEHLEDSLQDIAKDLGVDVQCLTDLGPRYEEPLPDSRLRESVALVPAQPRWDPAEYITARLKQRYPDGDAEVLSTLGKMNWARMRRLAEERKPDVETPDGPQGAGGSKGTYRDSGIGTSISPSSSYAETVMSYHGSRGGSIRIPPLPDEAATGMPFDCFVCGEEIQIASKQLWK